MLSLSFNPQTERLKEDAGQMRHNNVLRHVFCVLLSYLSAGGHFNHRDVHLADVGIQTAKLLECTAAVHAWKQWHTFHL